MLTDDQRHRMQDELRLLKGPRRSIDPDVRSRFAWMADGDEARDLALDFEPAESDA